MSKCISLAEFDATEEKVRTALDVIELQPRTKTIPCGGCSKEMTVSIRTVLAYCPACSAGLGVKK
jgi:uncharacterized CHY-type Zn-finger protein